MGAGRDRSPDCARDQGDARACTPRRPHRDRVLQRRGARAAVRPAHRGVGVTEEATKIVAPRAPRSNGARRSSRPGSDYTAASIQVLEGLEAVRRRPGMYIGSTDARGLHHLVWEVVDNSIDEAMAGHATHIEGVINAAGSVTNRDNGGGVPVGKQKQTGRDALEVVHTVLHAGGKFGGGGYKVSGGLHGVGVSVVNALSIWLHVESARDGKVWSQDYAKGKPTNAVRVIGQS